MGPEDICFRVVRPFVRTCVCTRVDSFSDRLAFDFSFLFILISKFHLKIVR